MRTSESIKNIAAALLAAQRQITYAGKNEVNPHFRNKYADLPAVIEAVKTPLNDNGIVFIQTCGTGEDRNTLPITTRLLHAESGEWIEDTASCPLPKSDPQGFGSAMTYLRRYCLAAITGLYQDDDDGNAASKLPEKESKAQQPAKKPASSQPKAVSGAALRDKPASFGDDLKNGADIATMKGKVDVLGDVQSVGTPRGIRYYYDALMVRDEDEVAFRFWDNKEPESPVEGGVTLAGGMRWNGEAKRVDVVLPECKLGKA